MDLPAGRVSCAALSVLTMLMTVPQVVTVWTGRPSRSSRSDCLKCRSGHVLRSCDEPYRYSDFRYSIRSRFSWSVNFKPRRLS